MIGFKVNSFIAHLLVAAVVGFARARARARARRMENRRPASIQNGIGVLWAGLAAITPVLARCWED